MSERPSNHSVSGFNMYYLQFHSKHRSNWSPKHIDHKPLFPVWSHLCIKINDSDKTAAAILLFLCLRRRQMEGKRGRQKKRKRDADGESLRINTAEYKATDVCQASADRQASFSKKQKRISCTKGSSSLSFSPCLSLHLQCVDFVPSSVFCSSLFQLLSSFYPIHHFPPSFVSIIFLTIFSIVLPSSSFLSPHRCLSVISPHLLLLLPYCFSLLLPLLLHVFLLAFPLSVILYSFFLLHHYHLSPDIHYTKGI